MKTRVVGKNPDGTPHTLYTPEGMSNQLLSELWDLHAEKKTRYPLSLHLGNTVVNVETRHDFMCFMSGLQTGFDMNQVF